MRTRPVGNDTVSQAVGIEFICWIIAVDKCDNLFFGHASIGVSFKFAEVVLLLLAPDVDVLCVFGVDVNECVKEVGEGIIRSQSFIYKVEMLELMFLQCATGALPLGLDLVWRQGAKAYRPALENNDINRWLTRLIDGDPL